MTDWETCPAVESVPGRVSGVSIFTGTRVPVSALFENLASGATVEEFLDWFPGVEEWQVRAVLERAPRHPKRAPRMAAKRLASSPARRNDLRTRHPGSAMMGCLTLS